MKNKYGFGGEEDGKKVVKIPDGYVLDSTYTNKQYPNRKYYVKKTVTPSTTVQKPTTSPVKKTTSKYIGTTTKVKSKPVVTNMSTTSLDRVYLEPDEEPVTPIPQDNPATAFMGNPVYNKNKHLNGTKIYSDRLQVDGMSMADRKIQREKKLARLDRALSKNPTNNIGKNTLKRVQQIVSMQEQQDMAIQKAAQQIYAPPQERETPQENAAEGGQEEFAYGGVKRFPYGTDGVWYPDETPFNDNYSFDEPYVGVGEVVSKNAARTGVLSPTAAASIKKSPTMPVGTPTVGEEGDTSQSLTAGDLIGMAGSAFSAVSPILNTKAAAKNTRPSINRFLGVGARAIAANNDAQSFLARTKDDNMDEIDTATNTAMAANRNGASSINTLRALNAGTQIGANRAKQAASSAYSNGMVNLFDKNGAITMQQDAMEAQGQTVADDNNDRNTDAYFTAMGENYATVGNQVQNIGKAVNVNHSNNVDANLLAQLSQYGLGLDKNGNLINVRKATKATG